MQSCHCPGQHLVRQVELCHLEGFWTHSLQLMDMKLWLLSWMLYCAPCTLSQGTPALYYHRSTPMASTQVWQRNSRNSPRHFQNLSSNWLQYSVNKSYTSKSSMIEADHMELDFVPIHISFAVWASPVIPYYASTNWKHTCQVLWLGSQLQLASTLV